jgi:integrase
MSASGTREHLRSFGTESDHAMSRGAGPSNCLKNPFCYQIKVTKFSNGERYPLLLNSDGHAEWYPTLFITTQARNASRASNTMIVMLGCIRILLAWCASRDVSLTQRFVNRQWLRVGEIESIFEYTQRRLVPEDTSAKVAVTLAANSRGALPRATKPAPRVSSASHYMRLTYIAQYLYWLAFTVLEGKRDHASSERDSKAIMEMRIRLEAHRPIGRPKSRIQGQRGLAKNSLEALLDTIRPGSHLNPFEHDVQGRNEIVVHLLNALGTRASELLQIKTTDFDFVHNEVVIGQRRNDPTDPRIHEPVPKTLDRRLGVNSELIRAVHDYILRDRRRFEAARRHEFLLVTHRKGPFQGKPLTQRGLNKIFETIRKAQPELLRDLHPHILRHTANDLFSELAEREKIPEAREEQLRSYKFGWKYGSGTARSYTRRYIEREANQLSLKMQQRFGHNVKGRVSQLRGSDR